MHKLKRAVYKRQPVFAPCRTSLSLKVRCIVLGTLFLSADQRGAAHSFSGASPVRRWITISDGKIFVYDVENVVKVRTGEEGYDALQGDEQF